MSIFEPILAGVQVRLSFTADEAWDAIHELNKCKNCGSFTATDLFDGVCKFPEGGGDRYPDGENCCEAFWAKDKRIDYWINKLVEITQELDSSNDFFRKFDYYDSIGRGEDFINGLIL